VRILERSIVGMQDIARERFKIVEYVGEEGRLKITRRNVMLSTKYRLRVEYICDRISRGEEVLLADMIWVEKLSKANQSVRVMLNRARRSCNNPSMEEGSLDDFMYKMDLGNPDPSSHVSNFEGVEEIAEWFKRDEPDDWRQRD